MKFLTTVTGSYPRKDVQKDTLRKSSVSDEEALEMIKWAVKEQSDLGPFGVRLLARNASPWTSSPLCSVLPPLCRFFCIMALILSTSICFSSALT